MIRETLTGAKKLFNSGVDEFRLGARDRAMLAQLRPHLACVLRVQGIVVVEVCRPIEHRFSRCCHDR